MQYRASFLVMAAGQFVLTGAEFLALAARLAEAGPGADVMKDAHVLVKPVNIEDVLAAIERPMQIEGHTLDLGTSIGIALIPDDGVDANMLLKNADLGKQEKEFRRMEAMICSMTK